MKIRNQPAAMEGKISGMVTLNIVRSHPAPDAWELSSRDTWIWLMADTTVRMPIMRYLMR